MWSNYHLQSQLQEVLMVNMLLEDKLNFERDATFKQASLVAALQALDIDLYKATSMKEKLTILQQRRELIQRHLSQQSRDEHEFSI